MKLGKIVSRLYSYIRCLALSGITLAEWHHSGRRWFVDILGIEWRYGNFEDTGHLFYIEYDRGVWKFDILWLRPFYYMFFFR